MARLKVSELEERLILTGDELIPFAENGGNGSIKTVTLRNELYKAGDGIAIEDGVIKCVLDTEIFVLVDTLPLSGNPNKIYLLRNSEYTGEGNIYVEYVFVDGAWEKIGEFRLEYELSSVKSGLESLSGRVLVMETGSKVAVSLSPSTIYKDTANTITVTGTFTSSDASLTPTSISVSQGSTSIKTASNAKTVSGTHSLNTTTNATTYTVKAVVNGVSLTATANVNARYPIYYGFAASDSEAATVANLTKLGATTTATRTYTSTNSKNKDCYFYILVPTDITAPTNFSMGGAPANMVTTSITLGSIAYKQIKSGGIYANGATVAIAAS